jgi:23S rRNA (uracil1939-C5)-methyltransferase
VRGFFFTSTFLYTVISALGGRGIPLFNASPKLLSPPIFGTMENVRVNDILENLEITDAVSEGKSMARLSSGLVVFVEGAVPGDVADVKVTWKKPNFVEAQLQTIRKPSEHRTEPFCRHFGTCGGCSWQHMDYKMQLFFKEKQVHDVLKRVGKVALPEIFPILPSANTRYYRNRLDFTFSNKRWVTKEEMTRKVPFEADVLGFHMSARFDKILDIQTCYLMDEVQNQMRNAAREIARRDKLSFFDIRHKEGFLRNMIIRNTSIGEWMVIMVFNKEEKEAREKLMNEIAERFPQITSLLYVINSKPNDTIYDCAVEVFKGRDYIIEEMEGLKFKIGAKTFYQTNSLQAYELYKAARDFAALTGTEHVYDLYTGTGTIAQFVAHQCAHVVGIDSISDSIDNAKDNAAFNNISNTSFFAGDMRKVLNDDFISANGAPNVIITDPPRAGMHEDVVKKIAALKAERVVYVSCNPATQARDLNLLDAVYTVEKVQPVDMFPQTHHVENVVLLKRKD